MSVCRLDGLATCLSVSMSVMMPIGAGSYTSMLLSRRLLILCILMFLCIWLQLILPVLPYINVRKSENKAFGLSYDPYFTASAAAAVVSAV